MAKQDHTRTIRISIDSTMHDELKRRAESMHLIPSDYCSFVLMESLASEQPLQPAG